MRIANIVLLLVVFVAFMGWSLYADKQKHTVNEDFRTGIAAWVAEDESDSAQYIVHHDTLEIIAPQGLTLWYDKKMSGNYRISYRAQVCIGGRECDRLGDLNCFWAAQDPKNKENLFEHAKWRKGIFAHYNSLNLYYVGYGGNENTTTRIRKYFGKNYDKSVAEMKPLIQEYTDAAHLLVPNKWIRIEITVKEGVSTFAVDGENLFTLADKDPYTEGYFGLRLLQNRVKITAFKIERL